MQARRDTFIADYLEKTVAFFANWRLRLSTGTIPMSELDSRTCCNVSKSSGSQYGIIVSDGGCGMPHGSHLCAETTVTAKLFRFLQDKSFCTKATHFDERGKLSKFFWLDN